MTGMKQNFGRLLDRPATAWLAGVALPIAMVILDPAVFRSTVFGVGSPLLGAFKPLGYVGIAQGVAAVVFHLLLARASGIVAGILAAGSTVAVILGLAMLRFSLLGTLAVCRWSSSCRPPEMKMRFLRLGTPWRLATFQGADVVGGKLAAILEGYRAAAAAAGRHEHTAPEPSPPASPGTEPSPDQ